MTEIERIEAVRAEGKKLFMARARDLEQHGILVPQYEDLLKEFLDGSFEAAFNKTHSDVERVNMYAASWRVQCQRVASFFKTDKQKYASSVVLSFLLDDSKLTSFKTYLHRNKDIRFAFTTFGIAE